jgi:hypothetical protein
MELSRFSTYLKDQDQPLSARGMTVKGNELIYTYPASPHFLDLNTGRIRALKEDKGLL